MHTRRMLKFLHTVGAVGLMGSMAALLAIMAVLPDPAAALAEYATLRGAMLVVANWVFLPSLAIVLLAGLFAIAVTRAFQDVGWVWVKLASGVLVFKGSLVGIHGPIRHEAEASAAALAASSAESANVSALGANLSGEIGVLWVMMGIATLNIVLAIWRPRFRTASASEPAAPEAKGVARSNA